MRNRGFSFAYGEPCENADIKLLDADIVSKHKNEYSYTGVNAESPLLLQNAIPVGQNFFYIIECFDHLNFNRKILYSERGVGELFLQEGVYYLKREYIKSIDNDLVKNARPAPISHTNVIIRSYIPEFYTDLFIYPYSVLCSIEPGTPTPVELQEKTLVGRLHDTIQSIDGQELREILTDENIVAAVEDQGALTLNKLILKPTARPSKPKTGTIIFNKKKGAFEGYDGNSWVELKIEKGDE